MSRKSSFKPAARPQRGPRPRCARPSRSDYRRSLRFEPLEDRRVLSTVTVTTLEDKVDFNDGLTSLREAIFATNLVAGADEITFAPALTASGPAKILLTQGELKITDALTITGPGASLLTIDASGNDPTPDQDNGDGTRIFNIDDGNAATLLDVTIAGVTLTGGDVKTGGAAVRSLEDSALVDMHVTGNVNSTLSSTTDGIIYSSASTLTLQRSTVNDNIGIAVRLAGGTLIASHITLTRNLSGVTSEGDVFISDSTISDNHGYDPALRRDNGRAGVNARNGSVHIDHTTINGNVGGGVSVRTGSLTMADCDVSGNQLSTFVLIGGAAGISGQQSVVSIVDCQVNNNDVTQFRTANPGGIGLSDCQATLRGVTVSGNNGGTAFSVSQGVTNISDCQIIDNLAVGFRAFASIGSVALEHSNVSRNNGGAVLTAGVPITIADCTFEDNRGTGINASAGTGGSVEIVRSHIARNASTYNGPNLPPIGGVYVTGKVVIRDSLIEGNRGQSPFDVTGTGGVFVDRLGNLLLERSEVRGNVAGGQGGGVSVSSGIATILDCSIANNTATDLGGGIFSNGTLTLRNSIISENSAKRGAGLQLEVGTTQTTVVQDCIISDNSATSTGGGISAGSPLNRIVVSRTSILGNHADDQGGGVWGSGLILTDSTIANNSATLGGGIWSLSCQITQCTISGNSAFEGGGILSFIQSTIDLSTIAFNTATNGGGGIFNDAGPLPIRNSIIAKNTSPLGRDLSGLIGSTFTLSYCLVGTNAFSGLVATLPGVPDANGNLIGSGTLGAPPVIDPKLGPLADNGGETMPDGTHRLTHALLAGSPAINAGDPAAVTGVGTVPVHDGRGAPFTRVFGGRIDMGVFEWQPTDVLAGDYNHNGIVDAADYTAWRNALGTDVPSGTGADGNYDGHVDQLDYILWKNNFGATTANLGPIMSSAAALVSSESISAAAMTRLSSKPLPAEKVELGLATNGARPAFGASTKTTMLAARAAFNSDALDQALLSWLALPTATEYSAAHGPSARCGEHHSETESENQLIKSNPFDNAFASL